MSIVTFEKCYKGTDHTVIVKLMPHGYLKLTTGLLVQQLVQANNKENIKALHYLLCEGNGFPSQRASVHFAGKGPVLQKELPCHDPCNDRRTVAQIPQCISWISHNAPFCNRNVHTCAHFCYKMVHCGIFVWCIVGFERWLCWNSEMNPKITKYPTNNTDLREIHTKYKFSRNINTWK